MSRIGPESTETESKLVVARGGGNADRHRDSFGGDGNALGLDR